jgi:hypothetical protein
VNGGEAPFYRIGGTLPGDVPSYVPRRADIELYGRLTLGEFCYVLTTRQMGKSSLVVRVAKRLRSEPGNYVVVLDLSRYGQNLTIEQWYNGLIGDLGKELGLLREMQARPASQTGALQRWMQAIEEFALPQCPKRLVIFIDEIDIVRSLKFSTDEFFAAIREFYNRRSQDPQLERLTFCLLGVATPSDLIRDSQMTPFNIGHRIDLDDFRLEEAAHLAEGLGHEEATARRLLGRVFYWTGGHPYLTQKLCDKVARSVEVHGSKDVDRLCAELFLNAGAREKDDNLIFVRKHLLESGGDAAGILNLYARIRRGKRVRDDEPNPILSTMRLSGIVRSHRGDLRVRNRLYFRAFDEQWIRSNTPLDEARRQRAAFRRGLLRGAVIGACVLLALAGLAFCLWYWDSNLRVKSTYYTTVVRRFGVPEGIGPLPDEAARHRKATFRLLHRAGRVVRCEVVDATGAPSSRLGLDSFDLSHQQGAANRSAASPCRWDFLRDDDGHIISQMAYDRVGQLVETMIWTLSGGPAIARVHWTGSDGSPRHPSGSTADSVRVHLTPEGFAHEIRYVHGHGNHRNGSPRDRSLGRSFKVDPRGLTVGLTYVGGDGEPAGQADGCASETFAYDSEGREIQVTHLDGRGRPNRFHDGSCGRRTAYDRWGNPIEVTYLDEGGRPVSNNQGYARIVSEYDDRGNAVKQAYFDERGRPALHKDGYAGFTAAYDAQGNRTDVAYFDKAGARAFHKDGYSRAVTRHDAQGNETEESYLDEKDGPTIMRMGYARLRILYNDRGLKSAESYYGTDNDPVANDEGYASVTWEYDERGNQVRAEFCGPSGQLVATKDGYASWLARHDEQGNEISVAYFNTDGQPCRRRQGYARCDKTYSEAGSVIETAYFDERGQPVNRNLPNRSESYARLVLKYDERNRLVEVAAYDAQGKPTTYRGRFIRRTKMDEYGNPIRNTFLGTDERLLYYSRTAYGFRRNEVERRVFEPDGDFRVASSFHAEYDLRGNQVLRGSIDKDGRPSYFRFGYTRIESEYNGHGKCTQRAYYSADGRLVPGDSGYARGVKVYDRLGNVVSESYYAPDGTLTRVKAGGYARAERRFNHLGKLVEERFFGADAKPVLCDAGFARRTIDYDRGGILIQENLFDVADRPVGAILGSAHEAMWDDEEGSSGEILP